MKHGTPFGTGGTLQPARDEHHFEAHALKIIYTSYVHATLADGTKRQHAGGHLNLDESDGHSLRFSLSAWERAQKLVTTQERSCLLRAKIETRQ